MENSRRQQVAADGLVTAAVIALGAVLVVAGRVLAGEMAPGASGDWLRIAPAAFDGGPPSSDVLLGLLASLTGLAVVAWWLLSMCLAVASALLAAAGASSASRWAAAFSPAFMRRLALATLGLSLAAGPAAHASVLPDPAWQPGPTVAAAAATASPSPSAAGAPAASASPSASVAAPPLAAFGTGIGDTSGTPGQPREGTETARRAASIPPPAVPEAAWVPATPPASGGLLVQQQLRQDQGFPGTPVEVRPGDSLWTIVGRYLGPGSSDLDIAAAWPAWYEANAAIIGDDPNVIRPGQTLTPPR